MARKEAVLLANLAPEDVPEELRVERYFDFQAHPFAHQALFAQTGPCVLSALPAIHSYAKEWIAQQASAGQDSAERRVRVLTEKDMAGPACLGRFQALVEEGAVFEPRAIQGTTDPEAPAPTIHVRRQAVVFGCDLHLHSGSVHVGAGTTIEPGVGIHGPTILGADNVIRQGAYFRGDVIVGDGCVLRGEFKNVVIMSDANFPHPCYVGDSLCGYMSHFGNQVTAANFGIFQGIISREQQKNIVVVAGGLTIDIGSPKLGIILGDYSQVGCNSVADPGTFLGPRTVVYALTRLNHGFYGPNEIIKNKPMEHGIIERAPLV